MKTLTKFFVMGAALLFLSQAAEAIVAPHDATNDVVCESCHTSHQSLGSYGYDNMCLTCHNPASGSKGRKFPFSPGHAANPFRTYTSEAPNNQIQVSHTWVGRQNIPKAGALNPKSTALNKSNIAGALSCATCHNIHAPRNSPTNSAPFLRGVNERDEMCLDCHRPWKVSSHLTGNHPVNVNYTAATSKVLQRPYEYYNPPRNANEANPTSEMKLKKGGVVCTTCHGVHYADSNSATFDSRTTAMVPKRGILLRTDLKGENANDVNICTSCHKGKFAHNRKGQNVQCADCHSAHVGDGTPGGPNVYLVRRFVNISTQYGAVRNKQILFRYTGATRNYAGAQGACVTCHTIPAPGGTYPDEHLSTDVKVCNTCHFHDNYVGSFSGGCTSCHGFPPTENVASGPKGFALGYAGVDESLSPHGKHAGGGATGYVFVCDECHKGKSHNSTPKSYQDVFTSKAGIIAGAAASYNTGTRQCSTMYCHSNGEPFDGSVDYKTPTWGTTGALACTACHDGSSDTSGLSGKHKKHIAPSNYTYTCEKCHSGTATGSSAINDETLHVNKAKDVSFKDGGAYDPATRNCSNTYCHSDGMGRPGRKAVKWTDAGPLKCYDCHRGRTTDNNDPAVCSDIGGTWDGANGVCTTFINMTSNGHGVLVGSQWIRKYPCYYCHNATVDAAGNVKDKTKHADGTKTVEMAAQWKIVGRPDPSYDPVTKVCDNVYCHSDGTSDPEQVRPFAWNEPKTECNTCHGHPNNSCSNAGCHDGVLRNGKILKPVAGFPAGSEWMASMPMFPNAGAGTDRANSHPRHTQTNFTCDNCHAATIKAGACTVCHVDGIPAGGMGEVAHIDANYHVNKSKDVAFKDGGTYNSVTKTCSNTACHTGGTDPVWGGSVSNAVTCLSCHGTTDPDKDRFNSTEVRINLAEWTTSGHGRYSSAGRYPISGNPAANFPGNPCWYCHDNSVLHDDPTNPYRLKLHPQYDRRFEKECVYCHMQGLDAECVSCHNDANSLAPNLTSAEIITKHTGNTYLSGCRVASCHDTDAKVHNTHAGFWTPAEKADVRNQYMMMGVCLQCHDDDTADQCVSCHTPPVDNPDKYNLGYDPGTGYIKPKKARASSSHFGYKHYRAYKLDGTWKGGKFCWDCHDPHGDANIFMIQNKVATTTEGTFGTPLSRADVVFTRKQTGLDYAKTSAPYNGICNVCHSPSSKHFTNASGDGHNVSRACTICHEHRFADSHASKQACTACHTNAKPVPKHGAFSLPRDCIKCHAGTVGKRMDITGQMKGTSHHVQGVELTNRHCYACHWESTKDGLIDLVYHEGFNYRNYSTAKNLKVDLVVWQPGTNPTVAVRPTVYKNVTTAIQFLASKIGTVNERTEALKVTNHCISCHSDQNNDGIPFDDCKTPRQYAWDLSSIAARYSNMSTANWGRYAGTANASKKIVTKAFSAHGNAVNNHGGWSATTGVDGAIPDTRNGAANVQCFDCHSSHGSKLVGVTSSYVTFNGTRNGANLKETQSGKGGYGMTYKAAANSTGINPYAAGSAQCFDCHETANSGTMPWGYSSTFGATAPIIGYKDTLKFGQGVKGSTVRFTERDSKKTIISGHLKAGSPLGTTATRPINGLCTPCHDPHGLSPSLGADRMYAVPLLKGTWLTSPYKEDIPPPDPTGSNVTNDGTGMPRSWGKFRGHPSPTQPYARYSLDRTTFGAGVTITEGVNKFAGLCISCHTKSSLTDGVNKNTNFKTVDRIHESVKGWGANTEHAYSCSKCHQPHVSGLPRLMQTNCLDYKHRGNRASGGTYWAADSQSGSAHGYNEHRGYPVASTLGNTEATSNCHAPAPLNSGTWPNKNFWNNVTPW